MGSAERPYAPEGLPIKENIGADGFFAVDMRVGRIVKVEGFPQGRKPSLKLTVDFGPVVGVLKTIAQVTNYTHEELEDRLVVGAINLGGRRIAGFRSEFLVLGAMEPDGTVRLLRVEPDVGPGAPIA